MELGIGAARGVGAAWTVRARRFIWLGLLAGLTPTWPTPGRARAAAADTDLLAGVQRATALARASAEVRRARAFLVENGGAIGDPAIRGAVLAILEDPAPTFMERHPDEAGRARVRAALVDAGLLPPGTSTAALFPPLADPRRAMEPFWVAPGGPPGGHHDHPGGLVEHTAFNVEAALSLERAYRDRYGIALDHDVVLAAPILHDAMKAWALLFRSDGTLTEQAQIAGTPSHHVFIIAEALHRGLPPRLVIAIAAAHAAPTAMGAANSPDRARLIDFLRAGAILAGVDPVAAGVLVNAPFTAEAHGGAAPHLDHASGFDLPGPGTLEATIDHLSDHDYVISEQASITVGAALDRLIRRSDERIAPGTLRWARHRIQCQVPALALYALYLRGGDEAVRAELSRRRVPLLTDEDRRGVGRVAPPENASQ